MAALPGDQRLGVPGQAPVAAEPGEAALDDPAPGQENEASGRVGALDDGQLEPLVAGRGGPDLALIAAVGEDQGEKGEAAADAREQRGQPVAVLDAGGMNDAAQQQAQRVDQDVALAAVDLLAGIVAARAAAFAGPDRLAVDDAGGRLRLTARGRACQDQQRVVQAEQGAVPPPAAEVAEDCAPRWEAFGQQPPLEPARNR